MLGGREITDETRVVAGDLAKSWNIRGQKTCNDEPHVPRKVFRRKEMRERLAAADCYKCRVVE